jgi:hypothetical protein
MRIADAAAAIAIAAGGYTSTIGAAAGERSGGKRATADSEDDCKN